MKKIVIVLDGVADRGIETLGGKTPLEFASTKNMDALANKCQLGLVNTIPEGMEIGSAVANLSLLGFDPSTYNGRAVIEGAGVGLATNSENMYIRTNFVTFEGQDYASSKIKSYSAYDVKTEISQPLSDLLSKEVFKHPYILHNVGSFRNILEVVGGRELYPLNFAPAHDIINQPISGYISHEGREGDFFTLQEKAYEVLKGNGSQVNGIWFWGASVEPNLPEDTSNRCILCETILLKGISSIAKIKNFETEATPFEEFLKVKLQKSLEAIKTYDDIYIHIQETDDLSHECMSKEKARAIELFDEVFLPGLLEGIEGAFSLLITSDHFTFSDTGGHGGEAVPFMLYRTDVTANNELRYTELDCKQTGLVLNAGQLLERMK